jgi:hypothetical protein
MRVHRIRSLNSLSKSPNLSTQAPPLFCRAVFLSTVSIVVNFLSWSNVQAGMV